MIPKRKTEGFTVPKTTTPTDGFQARPSKNTRAYRLKELKRLVSFWKEQGVCMTLELEKAVLAVALPCLVHLRARPSKSSAPGQGDIIAFIKLWCPGLYEEKGLAWARRRSVESRNGRAPYFHRADKAAAILGVTDAVRAELKLRTIGSTDVTAQARLERRRLRKNAAKAEKRRLAGAKPRAESLSRTRPWEELNMSRARWYRGRAKARNDAIPVSEFSPAIGNDSALETNTPPEIVWAETVPETNTPPVESVARSGQLLVPQLSHGGSLTARPGRPAKGSKPAKAIFPAKKRIASGSASGPAYGVLGPNVIPFPRRRA